MIEQLQPFIEKLKSERRFAALDEAAAKQGIILPLLSHLGWDTFNIDELVPEYAVADRRVDFALRLGNVSKVFIEVKKPAEELDRHQDQLLDYSFKQGVKLATLTNGMSWWFYLPLNEGSWEQRKFYTVDITEQDSKEVALKFFDFLSKKNVETGKALENAESVYKSQQKNRIIKEALPQAWNKLVAEADEILIDLLSETTEKLCGYKADSETVGAFLDDNREKLLLGSVRDCRIPEPTRQASGTATLLPRKGYTGRAIGGFSFLGKTYRAVTWIDLLLTLCNILIDQHGGDFARAQSLSGRKRPYFSHDPEVLRIPKRLNNTDLFVESNLSASAIVRLCYDLISLFGHSESALIIETT